MKRKTTEWGKIFVNHVSEKSLACRMYKEILQIDVKKTTQLRKLAKYMNRHFSKDI